MAVAKLAGRELARRRKHPFDRWGKPTLPAGADLQQDMLHAGIAAGLEAAQSRRLTMPNWEKIIRQKIADGMTEHLRRGGLQEDNTWRGGYDTHTRKFGSQLGIADTESSAPEELLEPEETSLGGHNAEMALDAEAAATAQKEFQADESGTEVTTAWTEDNDTADPTRDTDKGRGLESATKGTVSGRVVPDTRAYRRQLAAEKLTPKERAFFNAVQKVGGLDRYIAQHKPRAATAPDEWQRVREKLRQLERDMAASGDAVVIAHTDVPANAHGAHVIERRPDVFELNPKRSTPVKGSPGVTNTRPVLTEAFKPKPSKVRGVVWKPYTWQSRSGWLRRMIGGSDRLEMAAEVRRFERWLARLRKRGWAAPLTRRRSIID